MTKQTNQRKIHAHERQTVRERWGREGRGGRLTDGQTQRQRQTDRHRDRDRQTETETEEEE